MNRLLALALLLTTDVLAGCAGHSALELHPYSADETRQLALEDLSRRGLPFEADELQKAQLLGTRF